MTVFFGRDSHLHVYLPEVRPSFLDPDLACEPWIDDCGCEQTLVFFILNRPIALLPGSSLDHVSLATLLDQIRHRSPRTAACGLAQDVVR